MKPRAKVIRVGQVLNRLVKINKEIRYKSCFDENAFSSGVIAFRPTKSLNRKQINHDDKDVVCQVLEGRGHLRVSGRRIELRSGMICHIPKRTPHDFAAGKNGDLVLFYSLIKTG